ncbi:hypothetical protein B7494_g4962 [Chlorociboria aeruginascens]|nr:hypothetical protein B7494_g4962 [Chlorociboria aeruginascens]
MLTFRRSILEFQASYKPLPSRSFHISYHLRAGPAKSPRVLRGNRQSAARSKAPRDIEESLPPLALLELAKKSGVLEINSQKALEILRDFPAFSSSGSNWEQNLCSSKPNSLKLKVLSTYMPLEYDIKPMTLVILSQLLNRCPGNAQRILAKRVMLAASEAGEKSATFTLITAAIKQDKVNHKDYVGPLKRLLMMGRVSKDPDAMVVLGNVMSHAKKEKEALEWFRNATQTPVSFNFERAGEALVNIGLILQKQKDRKEAIATFEIAAKELDDPKAYFMLSVLEGKESKNHEVYLLKAAEAGITGAFHDLGTLYKSRVEGQARKPTSMKDYLYAAEWFKISAAAGSGPSMLMLASIHKLVGEVEEGLNWLKRAEEVPESCEEAKSLQLRWEGA